MNFVSRILRAQQAAELAPPQPLRVGKYVLIPLIQVRQDDVRDLLGPGPGVYVCRCPEPAWFHHFGFAETTVQHTVRKKKAMFAKMGPRSVWISATPAPSGHYTRTWRSEDIIHLGTGPFRGRMAQIKQTLELIRWLAEHRSQYVYVLVYNLYLPFFFAPLFAKVLLGRRVYLEYEDDYTKVRKNRFKNFVEQMLRRAVDGAICINEHMAGYFGRKPVRVTNGFADLSYARTADFRLRNGMKFVFGGTLDAIRGADLVPQVVAALRTRITDFRLIVTGQGPLANVVDGCELREVEYRGVLKDSEYMELIAGADAGLVLQKPDHPFSRGSFPSKIDEYARFHKPIWILQSPSPAELPRG